MTSAIEKKDDLLSPEDKYQELVKLIRKLGRAAVAFSGGVDSALLVFAAKEALGDNAVALTVWSPLLSVKDKGEVLSFAEIYEVRLFKIEHDDLLSRDFCENGPERCYLCKSRRLVAMSSYAAQHEISWLLDGSNTDDLNDHRPGMKALNESANVLCPLLECGLSKKEIREISSKLGLPTANKPSAACLASRIPTGTAINEERISKVDVGESLIRKYLPFDAQLRMRYDGITAKIETDRKNIPGLIKDLSLITDELASVGITDVQVMKDGYSIGGATFRQK
ncbi:MAG: ATP-dependent sacrificial sulfur transferase LarE [Synergistota bacterium]|nr:ATP-dependent sacrificial sulfur transferase LarE [Synergistota bacterium]